MALRRLVLVAALAIAIYLAISALLTSIRPQEVPDDVVAPLAAGVVADLTREDDGVHVRLADGTDVLVPNGATDLYSTIGTGKLLVYGMDGVPGGADGAWYGAYPEWSDGCFLVRANGEVRDDRLALTTGFDVALSEDWDETERRFVSEPMVGFCLNERGEATRPYSWSNPFREIDRNY